MTFRVEALDVGRCGATLSARDRRRRRDRDLDAAGLRRFPQVRRRGQETASESCSSIRAAATWWPRWRSAISLRELRVAGVVGRFHAQGDPGPYAGECLSACVYAMMGAVRRVAPPGSEVALHRMSIVETEGGGGAVRRTYAQFRRRADGRACSPVTRVRMGVNPALVLAAESLAARHDACAQSGRNAALVVRGQPVLTRRRSGRDWRQPVQTRARLTCRRHWLIRRRPSRGSSSVG